jgi:aconitate hydratase
LSGIASSPEQTRQERAVPAQSKNSFGSRAQLAVGGGSLDYFRLDAVDGAQRLPFSLKVL